MPYFHQVSRPDSTIRWDRIPAALIRVKCTNDDSLRLRTSAREFNGTMCPVRGGDEWMAEIRRVTGRATVFWIPLQKCDRNP